MTAKASQPRREQPRFLRPVDGRVVGGVSGALARGFGEDVSLVRGLFCVLLCAFGAGLPLYLLAWILIPEE